MNVWDNCLVTGIYTLTPTHFGTGQTSGAVDLPIARDESTGIPVLPATGLKGVARDYLEARCEKEALNCLFGKSLDESDKAEALEAGRLAFTEARLVAYPIRSMNRPFLHVTCRLILERLARDLRALATEQSKLKGFLPESGREPEGMTDKVLVADGSLNGQALVLEDLIYRADEVVVSPEIEKTGADFAQLLPADEGSTQQRLKSGLVVIPDADFADLMKRVIPVQARIKLTGGKTTDKWVNPENNKKESGNLWYEEHLPPECLFVSFIGERRQRTKSRCGEYGIETFRQHAVQLRVVQIGGNETVGQGLCYWTFWPPENANGSPQ